MKALTVAATLSLCLTAAAAAAPQEIAAAYLASVESGDLDASGALFAGTSSVFESGGNEGDGAHYREHHLGAEVDAIRSFVISRGDPETQASTDGTLAFVAWPIEYRIELKDDRVIDSKGTVTFVLTKTAEGYRIRHLHWSSRKKRN